MEQLSQSTPRDSADASSSSTADDDHVGSGKAMAQGLSAMLESIIKEFDSKANDTFKSQDQLSGSLDRLIQELDQLLENAPLPLITSITLSLVPTTASDKRKQSRKLVDDDQNKHESLSCRASYQNKIQK